VSDLRLPSWVYDMVIELHEQQQVHPTLYFTSGAFEGHQRYDWCSCRLLDRVPPEVRREAAAIAAYVAERDKEPGTDADESTLPASTDGLIHRAETHGGS
jgi:hypothetical protein